MKIWLDTTLQNQHDLHAECDPKECPDTLLIDTYYEALQNMDHSCIESLQKYLYTCTLQQTQTLYTQAYADEYILAGCPTGSGQIFLLDSEAFALLQCFEQPTILNSVIHRLGYLSTAQVEAATNYFYRYGLLRNVYDPIRLPPSGESDTLGAWLHVTNACNLRCDYCYIAKSSEHMQEDTALQAIDAIFRSAIKHRFKHVRLQYAGGEASLQADRVLTLHDYALTLAQQGGLTLTDYLMSNGVYISAHVIEQLKSRNIGVMISLDGVGEFHDRQRPLVNGRGSFARVDRTISRLLEHNLLPSISVTVSSRNIAGIPALLRYIIERNLSFSLNYYRENDLSAHLMDLQLDETRMIAGMREAFAVIAEHLPRYSLLSSLIDKANLKATHSHTCGVGRNFMVINQRGEIAKCQVAMKHTVAMVAVDDPLQFIRDDRDGVQGLAVDEKEGCRTCTWRYWCTGGCPALTYRMTGRYDIQSPNCHIYQTLFPDVLRLEALRLLTYTTPVVFV
jgi:uncharacterized protein